MDRREAARLLLDAAAEVSRLVREKTTAELILLKDRAQLAAEFAHQARSQTQLQDLVRRATVDQEVELLRLSAEIKAAEQRAAVLRFFLEHDLTDVLEVDSLP